jgi:3-carboxy-cis,cis-muconate cycloisomerase
LKPRLLVLQFGGAVGTLAALDQHGIVIQAALAAELGLSVPLMAWHTQRDTLVEFAGWLASVSGSLAKMGQDIILMAQSEIAEIYESDDPSRGGSSTMPQKRNPVISEIIIVAARQNANLLATMHQAMLQEHERATGSWQMEWLTLPQMVMLMAVALQKALFLGRNLQVNSAQMQANVVASHGLMLAEALDFALAPIIGRSEARKIITAAVATALAEQRHLVDIVREQVNITLDWQALRDEANYTGAANEFITRIINSMESSTV